MFCFGFYLDPGPAPKGPIIMGLLGNNAQVALKTIIGDDASNFFPTSGYAKGQVEKEEATQEKASDEDLRTEKPASAEQETERSAPSPGSKINKYGVNVDLLIEVSGKNGGGRDWPKSLCLSKRPNRTFLNEN